MKAKGFLDFSMDRLTERNKENSFLDVDWIISELITMAKNRLDMETKEAASSKVELLNIFIIRHQKSTNLLFTTSS
jgi:hypothetical protein